MYYYHSIYSPSFHHLLKLIILLFPRKVVGISFPRFNSKIMSEKDTKLFKFTFLKRRRKKEVKENLNLVALGRFQCLVALGRRKKKILFTSSHFPPPTNFT
jgi:hypothetical protein